MALGTAHQVLCEDLNVAGYNCIRPLTLCVKKKGDRKKSLLIIGLVQVQRPGMAFLKCSGALFSSDEKFLNTETSLKVMFHQAIFHSRRQVARLPVKTLASFTHFVQEFFISSSFRLPPTFCLIQFSNAVRRHF